AAAETKHEMSLSRQIAHLTRDGAERAVSWIHELAAGFENLQLGAATDEQRLRMLGLAALSLGATILATVISFLLLRHGARRAYARLARRAAARPGLPLRAAAVLTAGVVDAFAVIGAWLIGYLFALFAVDEVGEMETHQALFLNSFLIIELVKMV